MKKQTMSIETMLKELPVTMLASGLLKCDVCADIRVFLLKEEAALQQDRIRSFQKDYFNRLLVSEDDETPALMEDFMILKNALKCQKESFKNKKGQGYWFVAKDISEALGFKAHRRALHNYVALSDIKRYPVMDSRRHMRKTLLVNLNALNALARANGTTPSWRFYKAVEGALKKGRQALPKDRPKMVLDLRSNIVGCHNIYPHGPLDQRGIRVPKQEESIVAVFCKGQMADLAELLNQSPPKCCKRLNTLKSENECLKAESGVLDTLRGLVGSCV